MLDCPRIVVAGTHSGVGKTSLTLALVAALRRRGLRVQTFKVGPDFLDPSYLTLAAGRPCYNLDGWMSGREYVRALFARTAASADVAVIEGVMGLFDGANPEGLAGSTAEIAQWLEAPVLLTIDAGGLSRSAAAVVKGYDALEPGLRIAGVVANRVGSAGHAEGLAASLRAADLPPLWGAIRHGSFPKLSSRHLGLVTADRGNMPSSVLTALADAVEREVSLDAILQAARQAPPLSVATPAEPAPGPPVRLGVAHDAAFHFYYQDFFDELTARGCELVRFSPVADARLPEGLDALYFGGGYPEEHAGALAANAGMLDDLRRFSAAGHAVYGECGGLMYLAAGLETLDGQRYPLVGLLPTWTRMLGRLKALRYVEVELRGEALWGEPGASVRGHEFHYSELVTDPAVDPAWRPVYAGRDRGAETVPAEGFQRDRTLASYVHLHLASHPEAIEHFLREVKR
jgi:cobyrinic acid a,c-diamide synthase